MHGPFVESACIGHFNAYCGPTAARQDAAPIRWKPESTVRVNVSTPVFVTGIGRSGTSAVLKALGEHPDFALSSAFGEAPFIHSFMQFLAEFEDGPRATDYHRKNYKVDERTRGRIFRRMLTALHAPASKEEPERTAYWTSKISIRKETVGKFELVFPDFRVLYIIRNGIEVVNSSRNFAGFSALDFEALCRRWNGSLESNRFLECRADCAVIRHEDLVRDPQAVLGAAFERLNVAPDPAPARFIAGTVFNSSFQDGSSSAEANSVFAERLTSAWEAWSDPEKAIFRTVCGAAMEHYGFRIPGELDGRAWAQDATASATPPPAPQDAPSAAAPPTAAQEAPGAAAPKTSGDRPAAGDRDGSRAARPAPKLVPLRAVPDRSEAGAITVPEGWLAARAAAGDAPLVEEIEARIGRKEASYCIHPSPGRRLVYVETPKVACTSIKYLVQSLELEAQGLPPREFSGPLIHNRRESPLPAIGTMPRDAVEEVLRGPDYFRFTIVRDPFERALSCYLSKIARPLPQRKRIIAAQDGIRHQDAVDDGRAISFETFLDVVSGQTVREMDIHWRPQSDHLMLGLIPYDFIGRYDALQSGLGYVKNARFAQSEVCLPEATNATRAAQDMARWYTPRCIELVRKIYRNDFEAFGYIPEPAWVAA